MSALRTTSADAKQRDDRAREARQRRGRLRVYEGDAETGKRTARFGHRRRTNERSTAWAKAAGIDAGPPTRRHRRRSCRDGGPNVDLLKSADTIIVDGNDQNRTRSTTPCATPCGAAEPLGSSPVVRPRRCPPRSHARAHQVVRRPHGRARRQHRGRLGRDRRPARAERRRQDDHVLHDRRPDRRRTPAA